MEPLSDKKPKSPRNLEKKSEKGKGNPSPAENAEA
jgi:hypothetical protein